MFAPCTFFLSTLLKAFEKDYEGPCEARKKNILGPTCSQDLGKASDATKALGDYGVSEFLYIGG
jgi:hypothetical protein